ncbi:MAG: AsmA family protein [Candidatus Omnitrophota bacterium]
MKILKITLISFFVLVLAAAAAAFIFVKTFDINRYKPQIISQAGKALNRQVDFEKAALGVSLTRGVSLKIDNLAIADDPAFGKSDFLNIKKVSLEIDALRYVLKKEVNVPGILIDSPRVTIIRKKDGSLNAATMAVSPESGKPSSSPAAPFALPALLVSSVKGSDGIVTFIDYTYDPPLRLEISELSFSLNDISLVRAFPFTAEAAVLSAKKNVKIGGMARIDLKTGEAAITDFKGATELSDIVLEKIPAAFPMAKGVTLPEGVKGKVDIRLKELIAGPKGLIALNAEVNLADGGLRLNQIVLPIKDAEISASISERKIILNKASFGIGDGVIKASGAIDDYLGRQEYNIDAEAQNIKIQDIVAQDKSPVKAEGLASGGIKLRGRGFSAEAMMSALSGEADMSLTQANLRNINILRAVLDKISIIPGLAEKVQAGLSERYRQKLTQKDTAISDIKLPLVFENGRAAAKNVVFGADEFLFNGAGEAGLDGSYSVEGSFLIPEELSAGMAAQIPELRYLLNDDKKIYIPLKIAGKAADFKVIVDAEYIAKRLLVSQIKDRLFKTETEGGAGENIQQPDSEERSSPENIMGGIFDRILKK